MLNASFSSKTKQTYRQKIFMATTVQTTQRGRITLKVNIVLPYIP